jgi:hypothetical protein
VAVIASDERVTVLTAGKGRRSAEFATGATLLPGERVLVDCDGEPWPAVVRRRHPIHGALVEELFAVVLSTNLSANALEIG